MADSKLSDLTAATAPALTDEIYINQGGTSKKITLATFRSQAEWGDPGTEAAGININGTTYTARGRINDIGGTHAAQFIIHRHSTTLQPLMIGARSNSNDSTHAAVTAGQSLFSVFGAGWTGSHYDLFGSLDLQVGTGTVSGTSSPGKYVISLSPDGSNTPEAVATFDSDKSAVFAGAVSVAGAFTSIGIDDNATATQLTITDTGGTFAQNFFLDDNKFYYGGAGSDLKMGHTGAVAQIANYTGDFYFQETVNSGVIRFSSNNSTGTDKEGLQIGGATPNVRLYNDGTVTLETRLNGVQIDNDALFIIDKSAGNPRFVFDTNDYFIFDRTANQYNFAIGGASQLSLFSTYASFANDVYITASKFLIFGAVDATMQHNGSAATFINNTGTLNFNQNVNSGITYFNNYNSLGVSKTCIHTGGSTPNVSLYYDSTVKLRTAAGGAEIPAATTETAALEIGIGRSGDGAAFLDLIGDATYTDYGLRFIRNGGVNANSELMHRGTGDLKIAAQDAGTVSLQASAATKLQIDTTTTAGNTAMLLWDVDNATLERVTVGAADSGGTGYKVLRIPN